MGIGKLPLVGAVKDNTEALAALDTPRTRYRQSDGSTSVGCQQKRAGLPPGTPPQQP